MTTGLPSKPLHPRWVLVVGFILPSGGQVLNRMPQRAITFLFFAVLFGWVSMNLIPASVCVARAYPAWRCFIVQHAGLFFIWLIAAMDAYQGARIRRTEFDFSQGNGLPLQTDSRDPHA